MWNKREKQANFEYLLCICLISCTFAHKFKKMRWYDTREFY